MENYKKKAMLVKIKKITGKSRIIISNI